MKKDIFIKLLEYGNGHPEGFNYSKILNDKKLNLNDWEKEITRKYLENAFRNLGCDIVLETLFLVIKVSGSDYTNDNFKYIINRDSRFKYIDYLELEEAQLASKQASKNALAAIKIAIIALIISIFFSILQITIQWRATR